MLAGMLLAIPSAWTQTLRYTRGPAYLAITSYSACQADALAFTANQATLARMKKTSIGVFAERRFLLAAVAGYTIAAALPTRLGNIGVRVNYSGFKNFNEQELGLAYARSLGKKLDVGMQFNYYSYRVPAYGHAGFINAELGLLLQLSGRVQVGMHVYNPVAGKATAGGKEKLASVYSAGIGYDVSEQFFAGATVSKETMKPVTVRAGIQYSLRQVFFFRAGVETATSSPFAGAGVAWHGIRVDISVSHHPQLGYSPSLLLIYSPQYARL